MFVLKLSGIQITLSYKSCHFEIHPYSYSFYLKLLNANIKNAKFTKKNKLSVIHSDNSNNMIKGTVNEIFIGNSKMRNNF